MTGVDLNPLPLLNSPHHSAFAAAIQLAQRLGKKKPPLGGFFMDASPANPGLG